MSEAMLGPVMMDLTGLELSAEEVEQLGHPAVGGVILFSRNYRDPEQLVALIRQVRAARPGVLIAADTEGGRVQRFREGFVRLPAAAAYGELFDEAPEAALSAAQAGGWILAAELRAVGVDLAFAPVLDFDAGVSGVIGDRALSAEPEALCALGCAFQSGMHMAGMASTGKHFPGHGFVAPDSHLELPEDPRSLNQILALDWQPYEALLLEGMESIMVAHVRYPEVDEAPASISRRWISQILRERLGFGGVVFSDDLSMGGLAGYGDVISRARAALDAGCDMLPVCNRPADVSALLNAGGLGANPAAQNRLAALRGQGLSLGLSMLRESTEYIHQFNVLSGYLDLEGEQ